MITKRPIRLGRERGFCAGVRGALGRFDETLRRAGTPLYVLDELVHNTDVTRGMKARGAIFVSSLEQVPDGATLLFGAHGVPPETIQTAKERGIEFVDATCPLVRQLQKAASKVSPERDLILFGDPDHPEMKGVSASAGTKKIHFISAIDEIDTLDRNLFKPVLLSQMTRNSCTIRAVADKLKEIFPQLEDHAGVCNAVMARQQAVRELAKECEIILICGSKHSSNALRLKEIASSCGAQSFLIETISQLPVERLKDAASVGVSSGASTPEESVQEIVGALTKLGFPPPGGNAMITIPEKAEFKRCDLAQLNALCAAMRQEIVQTVAANGGHLSSSLGCVELITALHYVFDIPGEPLIFDVGHQALAHKLLTGRAKNFADLRKINGISGFPSPMESPSDTGVCGHAGVAISQAVGLADGRAKNNVSGKVIALLGDGAMNCGISWEGLTSAAGRKNLVIVLNDNNMAIARNVGSLARYLNHIISGVRYNRLKEKVRLFLQTHKTLYRAANKIDDFLKSALMPPSTIFQELGIRYIGPVNGHDLAELIPLFRQVRDNIKGPVLVHVVTTKGKGCSFAEKDPELYHGIGGCDPVTGEIKKSSRRGFSQTFGEKLTELGETHPELEAITASMLDGTGLAPFQKAYPDRCHDVGIEEEHAVAYAAGLTMAHRRAVVALYSTFAQRALDNIYHDVVLAKLPVIFALDRAGIVADGPTHHGIYDLGFLREMPGMEILAPATEKELEAMLDYLMTVKVPAAIRYPRGNSGCDRLPSPIERGKAEVLREGSDLVIWALGTMVQTALECAESLAQTGIQSTVINARFIAPFDCELARRFAATPMLTLEDHHTSGGLGATLEESLDGIAHAPILRCGWSLDQPIPHGDTEKLKEIYHLDAVGVAAQAKAFLTEKTESI